MNRHFDPNTLNFVSFYGRNRERDTTILTSADLVLTTYATVVAEEKGRNILNELEWYRVVLDEGTLSPLLTLELS